MKKNFKKLSALLLTLVFSMSTMATVFAAEPYLTYNGKESKLTFETNEESTSFYTDTDLFEKFKQVMPGDVIEDKITIKNTYTGCDYIQLYMGGMLHDESGNQISPEVLKVLAEDERRDVMTELEYMHDFLEQLTLTVKRGDKVIYTGSPNSLEKGFEGEVILLGTLYNGKSVTLDITLEVPFEMSNDYAYRIGEVDWIFVVEQFNNGGGGGGGTKPTPDNPTPPDDPEEPPLVLGDEDIKEPENPEEPPLVLGDEDVIEITDAPKTGDDTVILPYIVLFAVGLGGTILTAAKKRKAKEE